MFRGCPWGEFSIKLTTKTRSHGNLIVVEKPKKKEGKRKYYPVVEWATPALVCWCK